MKKPARPLTPLKRKGKTTAKRTKANTNTKLADQIRGYISTLRVTCSRSLTRCLQQLGRGPLKVLVELFGVQGEAGTKKSVRGKEEL